MVTRPITPQSLLLAKIEALEERQRHLLNVIDSTRDAVLEVDCNGIITSWNLSAERMLGWSAAEAIGQRMTELIVPLHLRSAHEAGFAAYQATRKEPLRGKLLEVEALHKSGTLLAIELSLFTFPEEDGLGFGAFIRDISGRRSAEQALRLSEERYRVVIEHAREGMIVIQNERVAYCNSRAAEIAGMPLEEMQQLGFLHGVHPDDHQLVLERQRARLAGEDVPSRYELRLLLPNGDIRWIGISVAVVPWDGTPAILTFFSDIDERKLLEEKLRDTLSQRETILESSLVGIAFLTDEGVFRWANHAMGQMLGVKPGTRPAADWSELFADQKDLDQVRLEIATTVREGRAFQRDVKLRRSDGSTFWVTASGKPISLIDKAKGSVWAVMDITARKELEVALERASSEREAIFNSALVGISFNVNRRIQWINDKYVEMTGYTRPELVGASSRILYDSDEKFVSDGLITRLALERDGVYVDERQLFRRNGESFWVQLAGRCVHGRDPAAGVIWTLLDITERRSAEDRMRTALAREKELNDLRSRFVSMTSHEFRTPLSAILSASELLTEYRDRMSPQEKDELLAGIRAGVQRMTGMLDRVLVIGQAEAEMLEFRPENVDLGGLCQDIADEAKSSQTAIPRELLTHFKLQPHGPQFDPKLLRHIFSNLLSNAFKYSSPATPIVFDVSQESGRTLFVVENQGIGIPAKELPHLFSSFHRASNVGDIPGTGLGLDIVKKSVELHGGNITVSSEPGGITRFCVSL